MSHYYEWKGFENLYFEDSYVLEIIEVQNKIILSVSAVLHETHPLYKAPRPNKQYCYKNLKIVFSKVTKITWKDKNMIPTIDPDGSLDYGNIDVFEKTSDGYYLEGSFGTIIIESDPPTLEYL